METQSQGSSSHVKSVCTALRKAGMGSKKRAAVLAKERREDGPHGVDLCNDMWGTKVEEFS